MTKLLHTPCTQLSCNHTDTVRCCHNPGGVAGSSLLFLRDPHHFLPPQAVLQTASPPRLLMFGPCLKAKRHLGRSRNKIGSFSQKWQGVMKTRAQQRLLCPAPWWDDAYGTRQIVRLFGDCGHHRIVEGDTNMVFGPTLLLLVLDRP